MEIFEISKSFPRDEKYSLTDQIRRSSRSVTSLISQRFTLNALLNLNLKSGIIIFPDHGAREMGKGMERKILKDAGLR